MVGSSHYKWYQSRSLTPMWGPLRLAPQSRTCLSHLTSDMGETPWWAGSLQMVLEPIFDLDVGSVKFGPVITDVFVTSHII